jgi:hypothetical protein
LKPSVTCGLPNWSVVDWIADSLRSRPPNRAGSLKRYQYRPFGETFTGRVAWVAIPPETTSRFAGTARMVVPAGCLPPYWARSCLLVGAPPKTAFFTVVFVSFVLPLTVVFAIFVFGPKR